MKTFAFFSLLVAFCLPGISRSQTSPVAGGRPPANGNTSVGNYNFFTLDVSCPGSFNGARSRQKLEVSTSELVGIRLIHVNPFKYRYKVSASTVDLFNSTPVTPGPVPVEPAATVSGANVVSSSLSSLDDEKERAKTTFQQKAFKGLIPGLAARIDNAGNSAEVLFLLNSAEGNPHLTDAARNEIRLAKAPFEQRVALQETINALDHTIMESYTALKKNSFADAVSPQESLAQPIAADATVNEQLVALWTKLLQSMDESLRPMQQMKAAMMTYTRELKASDDFDEGEFKSSRQKFASAFDNCVDGYNQIVNDFNSHAMVDTLGKFAAFKSKADLFRSVKEDCEKLIGSFYGVDLRIYTLPLDINGKNIDLVSLKLERLDAASGAHVDDYEYQIWVKEGIKFDISAGAFLTSLMDHTYTTETVSGTQKKVLKDNPGLFKLGFGSMVNMSYRTGASWLRPGLSLGVVFTGTESFQILTGPSLIIGKTERVVLHAGVAMGNVARLRSGYEVGGSYDLGDSNSVPTSMVFRAGGFMGLTYNLTKIKAQHIGAAQ